MKRVAVLAVALAACGGTAGVTTTLVQPTTTSTTAPSTTTSTAPPASTGGWAMLSPDGLVHFEEGTILAQGAIGWNTLARDRAGGLAFLSEGSLWWLPAGESEPQEVASAEGELIEVVPTADGPVARIGLCDSVYISLNDGAEAEQPAQLAVEGECEDGSTIWRAANGLQAAIIGPGVIFDAEGQVAGIEDVATLEILDDSGVILEIPVGGFYEAYARIHDFDGRHVIVSRGPFEPAMPEETYFVIDLETGEIQYPPVQGSASAALVGPDAATVPERFDATGVRRGTPLFTDDRMTRPEDGEYVGYITYASGEGFLGAGEIHFDLAVWFSGKEADYAALEDQDESPAPNDYYIRNDDPRELSLDVAPSVQVTSVWYEGFYETYGDLENHPITFEELVAALTREPMEDQVNQLRLSPWWVTIVDGEVVAIEEQYVP